MIPKIIHYCWFGKAPQPSITLKCIESWKKFCPDYEIRLWNEDNFDVNCCEYTRQAYEEKKWAFVSDVARFKILNEFGGLYFDTDVELLKSVDSFLNHEGFMGFEENSFEIKNSEQQPRWMLNPGLVMGCEKGNAVVKELLDEYNGRSFYNEDASLNIKTICFYTSQYFYAHGMKSENSHQDVLGMHLYPKDFFNPMDKKTGKIEISENTCSIHHYAASWTTQTEKRNVKLFHILNSLLGKNLTGFIRSIYRKCKGK